MNTYQIWGRWRFLKCIEGVFGSYARGEDTEKSDIDIAVEITGPMGLNFVAMADEIADIFRQKKG